MGTTSTHKQRGARGHDALLLAALLAIGAHGARAQSTADLFDRPDNNAIGNGWSEHESTAPTSTAISTNKVVMRSNSAGTDWISRTTTGAYNTVISSNTCLLTWSFNMRQSLDNPTGFGPGEYGTAVVLAGSNADFSQGQGYAVVLGTPNSGIDALRLVRYTNGLDANANLNTMVSFGDMGNAFLDVRVTYDPASGLWTLYYTSAPTGPFGDASTASTLCGSAISNWLVGVNLPYIGCLWNHAASSTERAFFDNVKVPYDCSTHMEFQSSTFTAFGGGGDLEIPIDLTTPSATNNAYVNVVLISGNATRVGNFTSQNITFNAPNETTKSLVLHISEEGGCDGDDQLVFELQNPTGGQGTPFIGQRSTYTLMITDEEVDPATLLDESFESDGNGSRYALSTAHATNATNNYFQRGTPALFAGIGGIAVTGMDGNSFIGGENMGTVAANAEASITFSAIDILGISGISLGLKAAARNSAVYDRGAGSDYILIEANVDGAGWTTVGAFRSNGPAGSTNKRIAPDMNLDGQGDGTPLTAAMTSHVFPTTLSGSRMDVRVRFRSTEAGEELYFDDLEVNGTRCRPVYYANGNGSTADPIWSTLRSGEVQSIDLERNISLVIQDGFTVTAGDNDLDIRNLTVELGGTLDLGDATVNVHGDGLRNDGSFTSMGNVVLKGEEQVTVSGATAFALKNVTVDAEQGVVMNGKWDILGTLQLENGDLNTTGGVLILRSNDTVTGRLGEVPATATYSGDLRMERYIPGGATNWRLLGSPVTGAKVQHFQDDFYTAGYPGSQYPGFTNNGQTWPSVRWYDEPNQGPAENDGMMGVSSNNQLLLPGQGFAAWSGDNFTTTAPFVIDLKGTPNIAQSAIALPMSYTNSGNPLVDGYNLVSNPLPSAIAFSDIALGADVDNGYSIFNPANGNMATWNGSVGVNGANGIIQSTQGFWLKAHGPAATATVTESAKVDDNDGGVFGGVKSGMSIVRLRINSAINSFSDETVIVFHIGSPEFNGDDVLKFVMSHPQAPQIATQGEAGQWIAINAYGPYTTNIIIPVIVNVAVTGNYTITANQVENLGLSCVRIEDLETGVITPISQGAAYTFTMNANDDPNVTRFRLHASAPLLITATDPACAGDANGAATIDLTNGPGTVIWTNAQDAVIAEQPGVGPGTASIDQLAAGTYGVRIEGLTGCAALENDFTLAGPDTLGLAVQGTNASCPGVVDGALSTSVTGGTIPYTYQWSNNATDSAVVVAAGSYALVVTDAHGCAVSNDSVTIGTTNTPIAIATASSHLVATNELVIFNSAGSNGDAFSWDFADGTSSTAPSTEHSFTSPGTFGVILSVWDGTCMADTTIEIQVETTTGIVHVGGAEANAWFDGEHIVVDHHFASTSPVHIEVISASGQLHASYNAPAGQARSLMEIEGMSAGIWFVQVSNEGSRNTYKVLLSGE